MAPEPPLPGHLADVLLIERLQSRYADVVTRQAWPELHDLFLPDLVLHLDLVTSPPRSFHGPDEVGAFIAAAIARFDHFQFVALNVVAEVDTERTGRAHRGRSRTFMAEIRHLEEVDPDDPAGGWTTALGCYQDEVRFVDGRWWLAERRYRSLARTGAGGAVLGVPPGLPALG